MSNIHSDIKRRYLVRKYEVQRMLYKSLSQNMSLATRVRRTALLKLSKLPRNSTLCRIRNRCVISGRARAVYRQFRLSRLCFREAAAHGYLPGIFKASW